MERRDSARLSRGRVGMWPRTGFPMVPVDRVAPWRFFRALSEAQGSAAFKPSVQSADERGDGLHRQLTIRCQDVPSPLRLRGHSSLGVVAVSLSSSSWGCGYPASALLPASRQGPSGPCLAYLSDFSDWCPLDTQGLLRQEKEKQNRSQKLEKRQVLHSAKAQK